MVSRQHTGVNNEDMLDGTPPDPSTTVSPTRNSMPEPFQTMALSSSMASFGRPTSSSSRRPATMTPVDEETPAAGFDDGILPNSPPSKRRKCHTSHTTGEEETINHLDSEETAFLINETEKYQQAVEEIFASFHALNPGRRVPVILELCCEPESGIARAVEARGGKGIRCGLHNGCDLMKRSGFNKVKDLIEMEKPDVIWLALPCGPTSPIQELNMMTPEGYQNIQQKIARSKKLATRAFTLLTIQVQAGRDVIQEWPRYNNGWKFNSVQNFWQKVNYHEAMLDGCAYDLKTPDGGLIKKPWKLRSTSRHVWQMQKLCQCTTPHTPCEGGNLTRQSALYPEKMCKKVAKILFDIFDEKEAQSFAVQESDDYDLDTLKEFTDQEIQKAAMDLLQLHRKLGHPSRQAMTKMLRDRGASKLLRTLANLVHCQDCQEAAIPPARRATTLETATELWEVIQLDNMEVTIGDTTYNFQIIIDEASGYGAGALLFTHPALPGHSRNATTPEVIEAFHRTWVQYFGYPRMIKLDKEGAHRGVLSNLRVSALQPKGNGLQPQSECSPT